MLWGIGNKEHLDIDYRRHVEYLQSTKRVLQRRLKERFGASRAAALWVRAQHIYEDFVREMPYTGGRRNLQAHALCDYYIMGDRTPTALASPAKPDEQGFLVNQLPEM